MPQPKTFPKPSPRMFLKANRPTRQPTHSGIHIPASTIVIPLFHHRFAPAARELIEDDGIVLAALEVVGVLELGGETVGGTGVTHHDAGTGAAVAVVARVGFEEGGVGDWEEEGEEGEEFHGAALFERVMRGCRRR
jgi:hypothetical protein